MQEVLRQLGQLFLQAVPTVIFVFIFYMMMRPVFFKPIVHAMDERHRRIEGAHTEADKLNAEARERDKSFQQGLHKARTEVFAEQEAARQAVLDERSKALASARTQAQQRVRDAKARIATDAAAARAQMEPHSGELALDIVANILGKNCSGQKEAR